VKKLIKISCLAFLFFTSFTSSHIYSQDNSLSNNSIFQLQQQYTKYFNQGENLRLQGEYEKSIEALENSIDIAKRINNKTNEMNSLQKLGLLYWNIGQLEKSLELYQQAGIIAEELNLKEKMEELSTFWLIYEFYNEGKEYRSQGQYKNSIKRFEEAIELARKIKSKEYEVKCLRQLSLTYYYIDDLKEFLYLNEEAAKIAQELNHKKERSRCLNHIGIYYSKLDNYSQALMNHKEALKIAQEMKNVREESSCLNNIGFVYDDMGDYEKALEYYEKALKIDLQLEDDSYICRATNNLGVTYRKKALSSNSIEEFEKAIKHFNTSLSLATKIKDIEIEIQALNNLGTAFTDQGKFSKALVNFKMALKKAEKNNDKEAVGHILNNIGIVYYNQGDFEKSTEYYQEAIDLANKLKEGSKILWEAYLEIANAYNEQKEYQNALENYQKSIKVIENIRLGMKLEEYKARFLGTDKRIKAYNNIIDLLMRLHKSEPEKSYHLTAFQYLERAKARAFLDSLEVADIDVSKAIDSKLLNQESELMKDISMIYIKLLAPGLSKQQKNNLDEQLKEYEDRLETLKNEIRISSPAYADLKYPQPISLEDAQKKLLDDRTAFFEYCIGEKNSYAFVVTKNNFKIFQIPPAEEIQIKVTDYLHAISDRDNQDFHVGYELFSSLVFPGLNEKIEKLIFIPDDVLNYLPFETLICEKNEKRWLINDYKIGYVPSISCLREIIQNKKTKNRNPRKDILAFGDPDFGIYEKEDNRNDLFQPYSSQESNYIRLQFSGREIERISSLFKKTKRNAFTRERATEGRLKQMNLDDYKIVHFATHGLIYDEKPARSSIVLSLNNNTTKHNKSREDGFLQMREIFNLRLNADLVTLSSCQTGLGQLIRGEGIRSLNRAFFFAGSSSVIISLWPVNDQASSQLMERFYTYLRSSKSTMDALQSSKLEMIASGIQLSHPYYWAGFIVTGNADKIIFSSGKNIWVIFLLTALCISWGIFAFKKLKRKN